VTINGTLSPPTFGIGACAAGNGNGIDGMARQITEEIIQLGAPVKCLRPTYRRRR